MKLPLLAYTFAVLMLGAAVGGIVIGRYDRDYYRALDCTKNPAATAASQNGKG